MYIKIYFDNKPLFLTEKVDADLEPYAHHDDAVFIDEFSPRAVNSIIHEMQQEKVHAGILLHPKLEELKKAFWKKFVVIQAAGGVVLNEENKMLFMFRRGKWDLPKGKLDPGETLEECAIREVEEETGLKKIELKTFLLTTYHTYHENGKHILKESHWYAMRAAGGQKLVAQAEEGITEVRWVGKEGLHEMMSNTFPSIADVVGVSDNL